MKKNISIIIPCYKENNKKMLFIISDLNTKFNNIEIIISDGSYNLETKIILDKHICSIGGFNPLNFFYLNNLKKRRSSGMNLGATNAKGDILLFLHIDTILPIETEDILNSLDLERFNYGGFYKKFTPNSFGLTLNSLFTNFKLKYFQSLLGDNSMFIGKVLFNEIGGFKDISLMEDVDMSRRLKKIGKIKLIKQFCITSSRKFLEKGFVRTIIYMQYMRILYILGTDPNILNKKYRQLGKK